MTGISVNALNLIIRWYSHAMLVSIFFQLIFDIIGWYLHLLYLRCIFFKLIKLISIIVFLKGTRPIYRYTSHRRILGLLQMIVAAVILLSQSVIMNLKTRIDVAFVGLWAPAFVSVGFWYEFPYWLHIIQIL